MKTIIFDIETGPISEAELEAMIPPFDPAEVKTGNLKDPEKIAAKLAEAESNHRRSIVDNAALDPLTGRVLAIGLLSDNEFSIIGDDDEAALLQKFWDACRGDMGRVHQMVGFNVALFDMPFLFRRSWKHKIQIPFGYRRGRYWSDHLVDLRDTWQLGDRLARGSLDAISRHLGIGGKNGDGKDFADLWQNDRQKAIEYLRRDLELTAGVAERLAPELMATKPTTTINESEDNL